MHGVVTNESNIIQFPRAKRDWIINKESIVKEFLDLIETLN